MTSPLVNDPDYELALSFWVNERDIAVSDADDNRLEYVNDRISALIRGKDRVLDSFMVKQHVVEEYETGRGAEGYFHDRLMEALDAQSSGTKHDQDKPRMDLLPLDTLEEVSKVLAFGAGKYGPWEWKGPGLTQDRLLAACLRHLTQVQKGEYLDSESNLPHINHAICNLLFMSWHAKELQGDDS